MQVFRAVFMRLMSPDPADTGGAPHLEPETYFVMGAHALSVLVTHAQTGTTWQALHREAAPAEEQSKKKKKKEKRPDVLKSDPFVTFVRDSGMLKRAKKGLYLVVDTDEDVIRRWTAGEETGLGPTADAPYMQAYWSIERVSAGFAVDELSRKKLVKLINSNFVQVA